MTEPKDDTEVDDGSEGATRREGPGTGRARRAADRLERGASVGRYMILGELGAGGMGVVYRAYDPELDRKVAIKLLQAQAASESVGGQAWLLREAQAMARLSHPNVIAVHDVGTLPGDRVFVAMELVEGKTLRAWLRQDPRPAWREIVQVMRAAGAGLAAAHASGLVHRDFKPENVLVGDDLRVRVMDFGLARLQTDADPPPGETPDQQIEAKSPLSQNLTIAGTLVGTPAYMAPELRAGHAADARSDQFSFGVALYEALFRIRPYGHDARPGDRPKPPPESKVPAHVERVALRAVASEPAGRYGSMDQLLADLAIDPGARRRRWAWAGAAAAAMALAAGGVYALSGRHAASEVCTGFDARLAGTWDAPTKLAIHDAFVKTGRPFAGKAYDAVAQALDAYSHQWVETAVDSCRATRVRGEQNEEALSLRQSCLDRRLDELRAVTQLLAAADGELVEHADGVTAGLEPLHRCSNVEALRAPGLPPVEPRAKMRELEHALAAAKAQLLAGHQLAAITATHTAEKLADEVHYSPYRAEAMVVEGAAWTGAGNLDESVKACSAAVWQALAGERDDLTAEGALCAAANVAQHSIGEARIWLGLARAMKGRRGVDPELDIRSLEVEGLVDAVGGDLAAAVAAQQQALAAAERAAGPNAAELWRDEEVIGTTYARAGAWDKAVPHLERAIAVHEAHVGPLHPDLASILSTLGAAYSKLGKADQARAAYQRALAILEKSDGPDNPALVLTLNNAADGMIKAGDIAGALVYLDRAQALAARTLGDANPMSHAIATTRAEALAAARRYADARAEYDRTIALETQFQSPFLGATLDSRATMELSQQAWSDAAAFAQRALTAIEAQAGKDSPDLWHPLSTLARADLELGRRGDARPLLVRAIAIAEKAEVSDADLGPVRKLLTGLGEKN